MRTGSPRGDSVHLGVTPISSRSGRLAALSLATCAACALWPLFGCANQPRASRLPSGNVATDPFFSTGARRPSPQIVHNPRSLRPRFVSGRVKILLKQGQHESWACLSGFSAPTSKAPQVASALDRLTQFTWSITAADPLFDDQGNTLVDVSYHTGLAHRNLANDLTKEVLDDNSN